MAAESFTSRTQSCTKAISAAEARFSFEQAAAAGTGAAAGAAGLAGGCGVSSFFIKNHAATPAATSSANAPPMMAPMRLGLGIVGAWGSAGATASSLTTDGASGSSAGGETGSGDFGAISTTVACTGASPAAVDGVTSLGIGRTGYCRSSPPGLRTSMRKDALRLTSSRASTIAGPTSMTSRLSRACPSPNRNHCCSPLHLPMASRWAGDELRRMLSSTSCAPPFQPSTWSSA